MKKHSRSAGFTLVEIAIVLVIIGLLLGGIMKGQSMIKSAKIKSVKATFTNTATAVYAYQDLTKYLPGDDPNALENISSVAESVGNGEIDNGDQWASQTEATETESPNVWGQLASQDLVNRAQRTQNIFKSGTVVGIGTGILDMDAEVVCLDKIPNDVARLIDLTLDNGNATSGDLRGMASAALAVPTDDYIADPAAEGFTSDIDLCNKI
jgi:prepilin-type N-terminal cleavage/methylation domain-containing protein